MNRIEQKMAVLPAVWAIFASAVMIVGANAQAPRAPVVSGVAPSPRATLNPSVLPARTMVPSNLSRAPNGPALQKRSLPGANHGVKKVASDIADKKKKSL